MNRTEKARAYYRANRERILATNRRWRERNPEYYTAYRKRAAVKLAARRADRRARGVLDAHGDMKNSKCELCDFVGDLVLDHDHATGVIRGWLCSKCNTALGKLGDTATALRAAVRYLANAERRAARKLIDRPGGKP